jgi:protein involved in polysaccharide export with SLBB domain
MRRNRQGLWSEIVPAKTKLPPRVVRPRHEPPTIREALEAAAGLTDEVADQIAIAASLMGCSEEEARQERAKVDLAKPEPAQREVRPRLRLGGTVGSMTSPTRRPVIVERVRPRFVMR